MQKHEVSQMHGVVEAKEDGVPDMGAAYMWGAYGVAVDDMHQ